MKLALFSLLLLPVIHAQVAVNNLLPKASGSAPTALSGTVNGEIIKGITSSFNDQGTRFGVLAYEQVHVLDLRVMDKPIKQAIRFHVEPPHGKIQLADLPDEWILSKEDIVHLGHGQEARHAILMPVCAYGLDYQCDVQGALLSEDGVITTTGRGIQFNYIDPFSNKEVREEMKIYMTEAVHNGDKVYTITVNVNDVDLPSIFNGKITGTITKTKGHMLAENGNRYKSTEFHYDLSSENTTKSQVVHFINWWVNCILPRF